MNKILQKAFENFPEVKPTKFLKVIKMYFSEKA